MRSMRTQLLLNAVTSKPQEQQTQRQHQHVRRVWEGMPQQVRPEVAHGKKKKIRLKVEGRGRF